MLTERHDQKSCLYDFSFVRRFLLLYVAYRFYRNGFPVRGTLFILAFLAIAYFVTLILYIILLIKRLSMMSLLKSRRLCILNRKIR